MSIGITPHDSSHARRRVSLPVTGRIAACVLVLATAPDASAERAPLTLAEARRIAVERSSLVAATVATARAARETAVAAGQRPDPVLKLGAANVPIEGFERYSLDRDSMSMATIGVMQEMPSHAKREARAARATSEAAVAEATRKAQAAQIEREVGLAWVERWFQQSLHEALARQLEEARLLLAAAEATHRAGRGMQSDVFTARAAVAQAQDRIDALGIQIAAATTRLTRWVGDDGMRPPAAPPPMDRPVFDDNTMESELNRHPQLEVARRQEDLANADVRLAERARDRDWSIELMFARRGKAYTDMVSVNISVPLLWNPGQRQDRELAARLALRDAARAQVEDTRRAQIAEVRALQREWTTQQARIARFREALMPLAQQRSAAALAAYRAGSGLLVLVLDARRAALDVELELLRLQLDAARVWVQLDTVLSPRTPESMSANAHTRSSIAETMR